MFDLIEVSAPRFGVLRKAFSLASRAGADPRGEIISPPDKGVVLGGAGLASSARRAAMGFSEETGAGMRAGLSEAAFAFSLPEV